MVYEKWWIHRWNSQFQPDIMDSWLGFIVFFPCGFCEEPEPCDNLDETTQDVSRFPAENVL